MVARITSKGLHKPYPKGTCGGYLQRGNEGDHHTSETGSEIPGPDEHRGGRLFTHARCLCLLLA
jgi:hypothetical protein